MWDTRLKTGQWRAHPFLEENSLALKAVLSLRLCCQNASFSKLIGIPKCSGTLISGISALRSLLKAFCGSLLMHTAFFCSRGPQGWASVTLTLQSLADVYKPQGEHERIKGTSLVVVWIWGFGKPSLIYAGALWESLLTDTFRML